MSDSWIRHGYFKDVSWVIHGCVMAASYTKGFSNFFIVWMSFSTVYHNQCVENAKIMKQKLYIKNRSRVKKWFSNFTAFSLMSSSLFTTQINSMLSLVTKHKLSSSRCVLCLHLEQPYLFPMAYVKIKLLSYINIVIFPHN